MDQVEEIKKKTDIVAVISEVTELRKAGRNYKGLCPFHNEKTPSFMVSPEIQIFKCFGCGVGGDVIKFVTEYEKIDFAQALRILADRAGVKLKPLKGFSVYQEKDEIFNINFVASEFYHYILTSHPVGQKARDYLEKRGVSSDAIKAFKLGFSPDKPDALLGFLTKKRGYRSELLEKAGIVIKSQRGWFDRFRGRIIFPLKDHFGNILGFAGRVLEAKGDMAKYINSPETLAYKKGQVLYGLETTKNEIKAQGFVVVVEGELDCISSWQAGVRNVVAIKGSAITQDQARLLARFTSRVLLALDADFAGDQAARRGLDILQNEALTVEIVELGEYKDPDEFAQKSPDKYNLAIKNAVGVYDFLINLSFKRYGTETTEQKAQVSRELSPILASIEDEIVRAHCIKQVAIRLNVPEEAVASQVRKIGLPQASIQPSSSLETKSYTRTRRDVLEEQLLGYLLQVNPKLLKEQNIRDLFKLPSKIKLIEAFLDKFDESKDLELLKFSENLPPELSEQFAQLLLIEIQIDEPGFAKKEEERLIKELELLNIKEEIKELTQKIKTKEEHGENLDDLEKELSNLGQKLSVLETQSI